MPLTSLRLLPLGVCVSLMVSSGFIFSDGFVHGFWV